MLRKIIHCDCDCFYAAIEMRDQPALAGRPLAVGGDARRRGVIATCNYEARAFGVRSAMSTARALRLCPQLVLLPPDMERYRAASREILAIYRDYTPLVEPLSLDEAYLDVSAVERCRGSASLMAEQIRARIRAEVGISASAGIAPNKFLAKVASDWRKPDGQFTVAPEAVADFVATLPAAKINGVGRVTAARLQRLGVHTCGDLQQWPLARLVQEFGRFGARLHALCRGVDVRPVSTSRVRKSLSVENTYAADLPDLAACKAQLPTLMAEFVRRWQRAGGADAGLRARLRQAVVKVRFADFSQTSVQCRVDALPDGVLFARLLTQAYARRGGAVRLLGVGVLLGEVALPSACAAQQSLF